MLKLYLREPLTRKFKIMNRKRYFVGKKLIQSKPNYPQNRKTRKSKDGHTHHTQKAN